MSKASDKTILVVGGGHAAAQLVSSLRQLEFAGEIALLGDEAWLPYQRPPLSKKYLAGSLETERLYVKPESFYEEAGVELHLDTRITAIDVDARKLNIDDGDAIEVVGAVQGG